MNNICAKVWSRARRRADLGAMVYVAAIGTQSSLLWQRVNRGERPDVPAALRRWRRRS